MLRRRLGIAVCSLIVLAVPAGAQESDGQIWTTTTVSGELAEDLSWSGHFIARLSDAAEGVSQLQMGADLEHDVGDGVRIGTGYSYVPSYDRGRLETREHRVRQQVSVGLGRVAGGDVAARLRLEQRWRDDGDDLMLRLRPRLTWTRPIGPDGLVLRLGHESFFHLNDTDWGGEAGYDRMRNSVALRRRFGRAITAEAGYLNQYNFGRGSPDEVDHALTFAITFEL